MSSSFDRYAKGPVIPGSPARNAVKIDKNGENFAGGACQGLLVGTAGTATLTMAGGSVCTDIPLQQGYNPLNVLKIESGGTADNIWALYP